MNWRLLRPSGRREIEQEIEEELNFHLELLTQKQLQQDMSVEEARVAALKLFGDTQHIKDQCVAIKKRNSPFLRALKSFSVVVFLSGLLVRALSTSFDIRHIGDLLIALPILTGVLMYVRGMRTSRLPNYQTSSPLMLSDVNTTSAEGMITGTPRPMATK